MIEQIFPTAFYPTLSDAVLPRALKRSPNRSNTQRSNRRGKLEPAFPIPIKQKESGSRSEWKRLVELLDYPKARRVFRHVEVQDSPTTMSDDKETVDDAEGDSGDREEVHGSNRLTMVSQESEPALRGLGVPGSTFHPTGYRSFREVETKHKQLAMNAGRAPGWILANHSEDQFPNHLGSRLSPNRPANPRYQPPVHSEAGTVPAEHSFGRDDDERLLPLGPESTDGNPEELVNNVKMRTPASSFQDGERLAKDYVF